MTQASDEARQAETVSINPATGEVIGTSRQHSVEELERAVTRARDAQAGWAALPVRKRVKALAPIKGWLVHNAGAIAAVISQDNGKTRVEALATEVMPAVMAHAYYARRAARFLRPQRLLAGSLLLANKWSKIVRVPYGVVAIISPWNYPFAIPFSEVVMALLAGNAVILKTASQTQWVGRTLEAGINAAKLPEGLFAFINVPGSIAGNALLEAGVDKLFFTGSVAVGRRLMAKAAESLTPVVLELGGNDAMLVCEDADLERASSGAVWAGLHNCGQSCGGVERIYVHAAVYEAFLRQLTRKVRALRVGPDTDFQVDLGAMTTAAQMDTVHRHVADALAQGAVIAAQSPLPAAGGQGNFCPAMVLTEVHHGMRVMTEETFGPVLAVMQVPNMEEAVALANDSRYGLTGSVWSRHGRKAERLGRRLQAGVITINDHLVSHGMAETPWGGFKTSGLGRTHGRIGLQEMTQPQVIVHDLLGFAPRDLWWPPYSETLYRGLRAALQVFYGRGILRRLAAIWPLLQTLPRIFKRDWP